jgi:serine/threonine protein kinase
LDVELEKDVLLQAHSSLSRKSTPWSPVPELLATIASHSALHIVFSFANCGTLWDLFCSTQSAAVDASRNCFDEQWLERNEGGNGTLFGGGSFLHSMKAESLFDSVAGTSASISTKRLHESTLLFYVKQLILAIQWLHEEAGVVHRDIKPENVLLMDDRRAVICDFGSAARLLKEDESPPGVEDRAVPSTQSGSCHQQDGRWPQARYLPLAVCETLHGTADYIAPEVLQTYEQVLLDSDDSIIAHRQEDYSSNREQRRGYDASVDWWSFGAMCYELITGMPPFYARTIEETYCKIVSCQVSPHPCSFDTLQLTSR